MMLVCDLKLKRNETSAFAIIRAWLNISGDTNECKSLEKKFCVGESEPNLRPTDKTVPLFFTTTSVTTTTTTTTSKTMTSTLPNKS